MGCKPLPENTVKPSLPGLRGPGSSFHIRVLSQRASLQTKQYSAHWREIKLFTGPLQTQRLRQEDEALAMLSLHLPQDQESNGANTWAQ